MEYSILKSTDQEKSRLFHWNGLPFVG